jgi:aryl-alcohol dehydrogenase-like predicted oxidoreductase
VQLRELADSGIVVSALGLGCNNFGRVVDRAGTAAIVDAALDSGITFFDTAGRYGYGDSERFLGDALRGRREQAVVATKFGGGRPGGTPRGTREYIRSAVAGSLSRLDTDYIDLLYYHAPDGITPIGETLAALDELVQDGTVRAIGCSNFSAAQLAEADEAARSSGGSRFVALQNQYSLLERDADADVVPLCRRLDVGFVAYFPLAGGLLTGKYERGRPAPEGTRLATWASELLTDDTFDELDRLAAFSAALGRSLHELALGAAASTPGVASVLVGATSPEQARANAAVSWELSPDELAELPRIEGRGIHSGPARR